MKQPLVGTGLTGGLAIRCTGEEVPPALETKRMLVYEFNKTKESDDVMVTAAFVEHAVLGLTFAILSLFVLAIALIAIVLLTITHHCWWSYDAEKAQLLDDYGAFLDENPTEPVESVIGSTPKGASIV